MVSGGTPQEDRQNLWMAYHPGGDACINSFAQPMDVNEKHRFMASVGDVVELGGHRSNVDRESDNSSCIARDSSLALRVNLARRWRFLKAWLEKTAENVTALLNFTLAGLTHGFYSIS